MMTYIHENYCLSAHYLAYIKFRVESGCSFFACNRFVFRCSDENARHLSRSRLRSFAFPENELEFDKKRYSVTKTEERRL